PIEQAATTSGSFDVLSISVDGLPAIIDPFRKSGPQRHEDTIYIAKAISHSYGIVNVQKDFTFHWELYEYDRHPFRTQTSGEFPSGSGLNTLSMYSWTDFSRIRKAVYIDMINLHASAGSKADDKAARRSNLQQIADFIDVNSVGNAVIVFGITNSRYTRSDDNIRIFSTQNNLKDAWVQATGGIAPAIGTHALICPKGVPPNINCEVVDKVLYRGSRIIDLESTEFFYDTSRFLTPEGSPRSDHHPVRVNFHYTLSPELQQSDLYGGPHGTWFNDLPSIPSNPRLSWIAICGKNRVNSVIFHLVSGERFTHGGSGGDCYMLILSPGDFIKSVDLCWGKKNGHTRIFYARANTTTGVIVQAGTTTNKCATATAPKGYGVVGAYGQDGDEMDQLGFIFARQCEGKCAV
ncbi:unnamed protein product, partial [Rhizoctonia solani]